MGLIAGFRGLGLRQRGHEDRCRRRADAAASAVQDLTEEQRHARSVQKNLEMLRQLHIQYDQDLRNDSGYVQDDIIIPGSYMSLVSSSPASKHQTLEVTSRLKPSVGTWLIPLRPRPTEHAAVEDVSCRERVAGNDVEVPKLVQRALQSTSSDSSGSGVGQPEVESNEMPSLEDNVVKVLLHSEEEIKVALM